MSTVIEKHVIIHPSHKGLTKKTDSLATSQFDLK
jgi:hypothetical protein